MSSRKSITDHHLAYVADLAGLTERWCAEAVRLLAADDVAGLVSKEVTRQRKLNDTSQGKKSAEDRVLWDQAAATEAVRERVHELYAANVVRPRLLEAVSTYSWESLLEHVRAQGVGGDASSDLGRIQQDVGRRLGFHATTVKRWKDGSPPGLDAFLGTVFCVLLDEVSELNLHERQVLVSLAVWDVIAFIKRCHWDRETPLPQRTLGQPVPAGAERSVHAERFSVTRAALTDAGADALLPLVIGGAPSEADITALATRVLRATRRRFPDGRIRSADALLTTLIEWSMPYALFRIGLVAGFDDTNDPDDTNEWTWGHVDDE